MLAAPLASGALMSFAPLETLILADVVSAAIGISILAFGVKAPSAGKGMGKSGRGAGGTSGAGYFRDLLEGLRYIKNHRFILGLIVFSVAFFIAVSPTAFLTTLQVTRDFGPEVWRLTAIETVFLSGMIAGGLFISAWGGFKNRVLTAALASALCGVEAVGLGLAPNFWLYLVIMGIMGFTMPLYNTPLMVLLQTQVEPAYLGRVISVFNMVSSCMMPAGMLLFGPLADRVTIDLLLLLTGGAMVVLSVPFAGSKTLRAAGAGEGPL
jgi:DHA3 family macrolide efflux protein-like MFS transporter